ncbi:type II toxin-antitoxin system HicA family toxin [Thermotoga sp.]|uniref:type II toxin-antitoxin system HicA family toxin n=1 Tax=Thermotoga sp. TaxID=28240 RepID=UPI00345A71FB
MSPRYLRLTGKKILRALQRMGIEVVRQRGSHVTVKNSEGKVECYSDSCWENYRARTFKIYFEGS